ncbi:MAG TPA: sulfur reduction protein DsrE, partial [Pseudomonadales bacterium]|nr:sulfur reduction protein DsrE [Pseudomonadales bacterium]
MKSHLIKAMGALSLLTLAIGFVPLASADGQWTYPAIDKYGAVQPLPDAGVQPKKDGTYKALFDVTSGISDPSKPEGGLVHVARAVNVFASAGVPVENLHFIAILHGPSTDAILTNDAYKKKYGV